MVVRVLDLFFDRWQVSPASASTCYYHLFSDDNCCRGPFSIKGGDTNDDNHATLNHAPIYPSDLFSTEAKSLLAGLLEKDPRKRLGCGPRGVQEIMVSEEKDFQQDLWLFS